MSSEELAPGAWQRFIEMSDPSASKLCHEEWQACYAARQEILKLRREIKALKAELECKETQK